MILVVFNLLEKQISNIFGLLVEGVIIFFISCYCKEIIGGFDEVQIEFIKMQYDKFLEFVKCKEIIFGIIGE